MDFTWIIMIVLLVGLFYFMYRSNKKQEREAANMRNSLEVGDEITTIGGIIGEIVRIKDETVTIETGKDRTKIRILRSAVRTVDVHAYEKRGDGKKPEASTATEATANDDQPANKKQGKKKLKAKELSAEKTVEATEPTAEVAEATEEKAE